MCMAGAGNQCTASVDTRALGRAASQAALRRPARKEEEENRTNLCAFVRAATPPGCVLFRLRTDPPSSRCLKAAPGALRAFYTR